MSPALFPGNIALHMFLPETRQKYDLESLWTVGAAFDENTQKENVSAIEDPFAAYLKDFGQELVAEDVKEPKKTNDTFSDIPPEPLRANEELLNRPSLGAMYSEIAMENPSEFDKKKKNASNSPEFHGMENVAGWHNAESVEKSK